MNDGAKRTVALAQDEAIRLNHDYIGTEHLLLGLIREGDGVAARTFASLGVPLSNARAAVEDLFKRGTRTEPPSEIVLAPATKAAIENARQEAQKLGHSHIGTEHLLLGLLREGGAVAVLRKLGLEPDAVRNQLIATLGQPALERRREPQPQGSFARLDREAAAGGRCARSSARPRRASARWWTGDRREHRGRRGRDRRRARRWGDRCAGDGRDPGVDGAAERDARSVLRAPIRTSPRDDSRVR